jgi:hypothetical protein
MTGVRAGALGLATLALAVSACGGGDPKPASSAPKATATATSTPAAASTTAVRLTPVGTTLKVGKPAVLAYKDATKTSLKSVVEITPRSIVPGSMKDFANVQLDDKEKTATPFYVKVHAKNVGKGDLSKTDPADYLSGVDDRGQRQNAVIFLGTFDACDNVSPPKSLKPGQSYDTCQVYLIPKGGSLDGLVWVAFDPSHPNKKDINWRP